MLTLGRAALARERPPALDGTTSIAPVPLATPSDDFANPANESTVNVSGWGSLDPDPDNQDIGDYPLDLQAIELTLVPTRRLPGRLGRRP